MSRLPRNREDQDPTYTEKGGDQYRRSAQLKNGHGTRTGPPQKREIYLSQECRSQHNRNLQCLEEKKGGQEGRSRGQGGQEGRSQGQGGQEGHSRGQEGRSRGQEGRSRGQEGRSQGQGGQEGHSRGQGGQEGRSRGQEGRSRGQEGRSRERGEQEGHSRERGRQEGRSRERGRQEGHSWEREEQNHEYNKWKRGDLYRDIDRPQRMNPDRFYSSNDAHHQESDHCWHEIAPPSLGYTNHHPGWSVEELEYPEGERDGGILECNKCRYLCTGRGVLQILEVLLNALLLICVISSYFVLSGFSSGFGSSFYSPFEGQELQQVRQLDQQFTVLRAPLLYSSLAFSLVVGALTLGLLAGGSKHRTQLSRKWLLVEATFSLLGSLSYAAAVGVFLHFALQINSTDVCKRRERLYARNGLTWMSCDLAGTDGAAATFGILLVIFYGVSVALAIRTYRETSNAKALPKQEAHTLVNAWPSAKHAVAGGKQQQMGQGSYPLTVLPWLEYCGDSRLSP